MDQYTEWTFPANDEGTENDMNTTTPETKENTMNSTNMEMQMQPATSNVSAGKKTRISREMRLNTLRAHIEDSLSFEEIQVAMNLTQTELALLYFELTQVDGRSYTIQRTRRVKMVKVGTNGSFQVSADNITRMGLDNIFREGAIVSFRRDGDSIVASVVADKTAPADTESPSKPVPAEQPEAPNNGLEENASVSVRVASEAGEETVIMSAEQYRMLTGQEPPKVAILEREVA